MIKLLMKHLATCDLRILVAVVQRHTKLNDEVENLIYYSENCTGRNHTFSLSLMYEITIKLKRNLKSTEHKCLVVGHIHMECDWDHACLERAKPKDMETCTPRDWYTIF